eukprot:449246_1
MSIYQVFLYFIICLKSESCPPTIETYCLEGRTGFNNIINGEYIYTECYNNMPYFQNKNSNDPIYMFFTDTDSILFGPDYTTTNAYAFCKRSSFEDCYHNIIVYDGSEWESEPDSSIYFGSDCYYARNTPSLCTDLTEISIEIAFDTEQLSGIYTVNGCYNSKPHLSKHISDSNKLYIYYESNSKTYYISEIFADLSTVKATCDLNIYPYASLSHCLFLPTQVENDVIFSFEMEENELDYTLIIGFPLSGLYFIVVCIVIIIVSKKNKSNSDATNKSNNKSVDIENNKSGDIEMEKTNKMEGATNVIESGIQSKMHSKIQNKYTEKKNTKKWTVKFIAKCVFVFIIKPAIEIYDYYTDITLSMIWLNENYGFDHKCRLNYDKYAYPLLICSSVGFCIGIIGHIYNVFHSYFVNKRLSYQSLTDLKQEKVNYYVLTKMLIEDTVAIIIFIVVSQNEVGITDNNWWFAYYSSCAGFMLSAILLLRKNIAIMKSRSNRGKLMIIGLLTTIGFGLPLFGTQKSTNSFQLGFALNNNECQLFEREWSDYFTFEVEDDERYSIFCGAIYDDTGSSGFEYDKGYISGLYCNLYDPSHIDDGVLCAFWMFEQECWSGECSPYSENIEVCFGYIGFA